MSEPKYTHKTVSQGCALKVTPSDRSMDVLHYLITGYLMGKRSLDDVSWEEIENPHATKALSRSMQHSQERNV